MNLLSELPHGMTTAQLILLAVILGASATMSGLSGFGFSAIGALSLAILPPKMGVPLLMALSTANQLMSLGQLKADLKPVREWWPDGPAPYLLGGLVGVPIGLSILHSLPTSTLMLVFGGFLVLYSAYSMLKPESLHVEIKGGTASSAIVGMMGGIIGGFTAFPGAAVVVWSGLRRLAKTESRSIVQPYILGLQIISLTLLAIQRPETFSRGFWTLLAISIPVVLPGTLLGVNLYKNLSDINFRRITFFLLGASGLGLLAKAVAALGLFATAAAR
ncbi:MAG TPA: sulfite exporter TauE/SafE family protein [Caulobacteraceae bacterium]|nr:sulfite exporter TauE/SafE family protein [Caulobacteraceae bacterium]